MVNNTGTPEEAKQKTAAAYNSASDLYDHPANSFWSRFGRRTVDRIDLAKGSRVLDVCCGSGASAIPAAQAVGDKGSVVGVDLAQNLLNLAKTKAAQQNLANTEFRQADLMKLGYDSESFDAVICVFGIFFVPDMNVAVHELWRLVKPGGKLAITTWGERFFEPASSVFWNAVRRVRPDLHKAFNPWDRISEVAALQFLLTDAGAENVEVVAENNKHDIGSPDDWWTMILGSGYRGTVDQLNETDYETVRNENLHFIRQSNVRSVEANVLYGLASKSL